MIIAVGLPFIVYLYLVCHFWHLQAISVLLWEKDNQENIS